MRRLEGEGAAAVEKGLCVCVYVGRGVGGRRGWGVVVVMVAAAAAEGRREEEEKRARWQLRRSNKVFIVFDASFCVGVGVCIV